MKKDNRALGMVMVSVLMLNTISIQASDIQIDETDIVSPVQEKAVYSLKYDVAVNDNTLMQELSTFENDIVEMKFNNYDIGEQTVTIGYNGVMKDINSVLESVYTELYSIYEFYQKDSRLPNPTSEVNKSALKLNDVTVLTSKTIESSDYKLATVIENKTVRETEEKANVKPLRTSTSVFDAHHKYNYGYYYTGWANAIEHYTNGNLDRICKVYGQEVMPDDYIRPHEGDGHERFAEGYQWQPDIIQVGFDNNYSSGKNRVKLYYEYLSSSNQLANLQVTGNEGLEVSIVFYNYPNADISSQKGTAYVEQYQMNDGVVWSSNQPTAYLDTGFNLGSASGVNKDLVTYCIGVEDASKLDTGVFYYWSIPWTSGVNRGDNRYINDGRFVVNCNRTYESSSIYSIVGSWVDGAAGQVTWKRFEEEHEGTVIPKIRKATGTEVQQNWYNGYNNETLNYSAWYLAETHTEWEYRSSIHVEMVK